MCKITDITIDGYRGISALRLHGLRRVNLLLGNNSSGKSSALEAVLILIGAANPALPVQMNRERNYGGIRREDLQLFFHGLQTDTPITMTAAFEDGGGRELQISFFESPVQRVPIADVEKDGAQALAGGTNYGLLYRYTDKGEAKPKTSRLLVRPEKKEVSATSPDNGKPPREAAFVAPRYNFNDFISHFSQIVTDKEKEAVLDVLRGVEPGIRDVAVVGDRVMVDTGLPRLVPINVLGDGVRKMFTLITAMYSVRGGILLIDEIDNGLYYKTMRTLWTAILTAAEKLNVQVFASTHSLDSLRSLRTVVEDGTAGNAGSIGVYTLRRTPDGRNAALAYGFSEFSYILGQEVEIR